MDNGLTFRERDKNPIFIKTEFQLFVYDKNIMHFIIKIRITLFTIIGHFMRKSPTPTSSGGLRGPPKGPLLLARLKGGCRKRFYWLPLKSGSFTIFFS